jgi:hypothetical protein
MPRTTSSVPLRPHARSIPPVELSKVRRNEIFNAVEEGGLDPRDCGWDNSNEQAAKVSHRPTGATLTVSWTHALGSKLEGPPTPDDRFNITYQVEPAAVPVKHNSYRWKEVPRFVMLWAGRVVDNETLPDLWIELGRGKELLEAAQVEGASSAPFTAEEQTDIARSLDMVKQLVREQFDLTDEKLAAIDQRLDDAREAAKKTGRKTWLYMLYGALMSTFLTDEIPPQVVQTALDTAVHGIAHIFGVGGPPPIITA